MIDTISWNAETSSWEGEANLVPGSPIRFSLVDEEKWATTSPASLLEIATAFLQWAGTFEPHCRERIADNLLRVYNEAWADDDPDEGPPPCTRPEFIAALQLDSISLDESGSSSWIYKCGDLFAGHAISLMLNADHSFLGKARLWG